MDENEPVFHATLNAVQDLLRAELAKLPEYHCAVVTLNVWARSITRQCLAQGTLPTADLIHSIVTDSAPIVATH
jgi:DNA repair protein RadC